MRDTNKKEDLNNQIYYSNNYDNNLSLKEFQEDKLKKEGKNDKTKNKNKTNFNPSDELIKQKRHDSNILKNNNESSINNSIKSPETNFESLLIQTTAYSNYIEEISRQKIKLHLSNFEKLLQVGEGTYGKVFKVRVKSENNCQVIKPLLDCCNIKAKSEIFALKKLIYSEEEVNGFPITAIREISILQELDHKNILKLLDIVTSKASCNSKNGNVYLVLEYMEYDLSGLLEKGVKFDNDSIKGIMYQVIEGVDYMHRSKGIIHRDIKASNILINNNGVVKIADFGLARHFSNRDFNKKHYTSKVVTLWYRAPELFMGETFYKEEVDMWSLGILLWQLHIGKAPIRSKSDDEQYIKILEVLGNIDLKAWPEAEGLRKYKQMNENQPFFSCKLDNLLQE